MAEFDFEREVRTPYSEAYTILEDDRAIGRVDIHFSFSVVHVTLAVDESLTQGSIQELINIIDDELVDVVGVNREELIVHVFQGREAGVFTDEGFSENGSDH